MKSEKEKTVKNMGGCWEAIIFLKSSDKVIQILNKITETWIELLNNEKKATVLVGVESTIQFKIYQM